MAGKYLKKKKISLSTVLLCLFCGMIVIGGAGLLISQQQYKRGIDSYASLAQNAGMELPEKETVEVEVSMVEQKETEAGAQQPEAMSFRVDFNYLRQVNEDIVGWLISDSGEINYPIVRGADNSYYLNHLFDGTYNKNGALFMDYRNTPGFVDRNTFIYGHNMKNGSMFAPLLQYADQAYYDAYPEMRIITPDGTYRLEIFSGYTTTGDSASYQLDFYDDGAYVDYISQIKEQSDFVSDVEVDTEDKIITLSTCAYSFDEARYLVHAKLVKEENAAS